MDEAKKAKKVKYHITYRVNGSQKKGYIGYSIEHTRDADAGRRSQKRENKLEDLLDIQAEGKTTFSN